MSDSRRHKTVIPASCTVRSARRVTDRRVRLLACSMLTGGTLRSLAAAAGMMTALGVSPAFAQCFSGGGSQLTTAAGACQAAAATGTGSTAVGIQSNATGQDATAYGNAATAIGFGATATGQGSAANGSATTATGQFS